MQFYSLSQFYAFKFAHLFFCSESYTTLVPPGPNSPLSPAFLVQIALHINNESFCLQAVTFGSSVWHFFLLDLWGWLQLNLNWFLTISWGSGLVYWGALKCGDFKRKYKNKKRYGVPEVQTKIQDEKDLEEQKTQRILAPAQTPKECTA